MTVLALLALWFRQNKDDRNPQSVKEVNATREMLESLQRLPISFGMALSTRDQCKAVAKDLAEKKNMFILGKGYA